MTTTRTRSELEELVLDCLQEVAPEIDAEGLEPDVAFRDQSDFDSVDFLNFALALEDRLGTRIPEVEYPKLSSLKGCLDYLDSAETAAPEDSAEP